MSIPEHILRALLALGNAKVEDDTENLLRELDPYHREAHAVGRKSWTEVANASSPAELQSMIRGVVRAEQLGKWYGGSVSVVITLFKAYQGKRQPDEDELAEWVMRNSSNDYEPYGTSRGSARSLEELWALNRRVADRKRAAAHEEQRRAEEGAQRRKEAAERYVQRREVQKAATADRKVEMERLRSLSTDERLCFLLGVPPRSFGYYPVALLSDDLAFEESLTKELRSELVRLIRTSGDRAWMKWAKDTFGPFSEITSEEKK